MFVLQTTAAQKARARMRQRRKAPDAAFMQEPANDVAPGVADDFGFLDAELTGEDEFLSAEVVVFPVERSDEALPPFDPPDPNDDVFGALDGEEADMFVPEYVAEPPALMLDERVDGELELTSADIVSEPAPVVEEPAFEQEAELAEPAPEPELEIEAAPPAMADEEVPFDAPDQDEHESYRLIVSDEPEAVAPPPPSEDAEAAPRVISGAPGRPEARVSDVPAPPISIYACWDRANFADLFEAVASDRRLARAEFEIERGGLAAAIERVGRETPDCFIIDSTLERGALLAHVDRLADVMASGVRVILLGAVNDVMLFRELHARGVSEYIVGEPKPEAVARLICGLFAYTDKSRVIAVMGARGGVGASTIAHNLAWSIAERHDLNAALVDLDLPFGTVGFSFKASGAENETAGEEQLILATECAEVALAPFARQQTDRLQVVSSSIALERTADLTPESVEALILSSRRTSPFVVLDLPHLWQPWVKQALAMADDVVFVASPDLANLRDTDNLLKQMAHIRPDLSPLVLLSMVGVPKRPEVAIKDFAEAIGVAPALSFAFEPELHGACFTGAKTLYEASPKSKAAIAIDGLASMLTGREPVARKKPRRKPAPAPKRTVEAVAQPKPAEPAAPLPAAPPEQPLDLVLVAAPAPAEAPAQDEPLTLDVPAPTESDPESVATVIDAPAQEVLTLTEFAPEKRRSTGLLRAAAAITAMITLSAWYIEEQRQTAQAAEAPTRITLAPVAAPPDMTPQYRRALELIETGATAEGVALLRHAADRGSALAQHRLAKFYEMGEGVERDLLQARAWTERAAASGNRLAMHDLGVYNARGEGAPVDVAAAFRWFRQAAELDVADSQFNLGVLYEQGRGVSADPAEALFWFLVAARNGDEATRARATEIEARLTPMQVEQARARAAAFRPRQMNPAANEPMLAPVAPSAVLISVEADAADEPTPAPVSADEPATQP